MRIDVRVDDVIPTTCVCTWSARCGELIKSLELLAPAECRPLTSQFHNPESFCRYLDKARKMTVKQEGWRRSVIKTEFGVNRTGVLRPVLPVLVDVLKSAGRIDALIPFDKQHSKEGKGCSQHCGTLGRWNNIR